MFCIFSSGSLPEPLHTGKKCVNMKQTEQVDSHSQEVITICIPLLGTEQLLAISSVYSTSILFFLNLLFFLCLDCYQNMNIMPIFSKAYAKLILVIANFPSLHMCIIQIFQGFFIMLLLCNTTLSWLPS